MELYHNKWSMLLLKDLFQGMGAWRKTMEPQKPGNSPGPGPEVESRKRASEAKGLSWTVQNGMRAVLGRMTAGAA